jgi:hypothetical protein
VAAEVVRNNQRYLQAPPETADGTPLDDAPDLRVPPPAPRLSARPNEATDEESVSKTPAPKPPPSPRLPAGDGDASTPERVVLASRATPPASSGDAPDA